MRVLSHDEIQAQYEQIKDYHKQYLAQQGVILPRLTHGKTYTKDALTLVYLSLDYPNTHVVSKKELTEFIRTFYPEVSDVQQARHLAAQKGWYILSGTRKDNASCSIPPENTSWIPWKCATQALPPSGARNPWGKKTGRP